MQSRKNSQQIEPQPPSARRIARAGSVTLAFVAGLMLAFLAATARPSCKQLTDANGNLSRQWGQPAPTLWGRP
jgi:hypothetical protein